MNSGWWVNLHDFEVSRLSLEPGKLFIFSLLSHALLYSALSQLSPGLCVL